jgi:hypothetical protein
MNGAREQGRQWVGIILAIGLALAVLCVTVGVLYDAIVSAGPGLSDNATQVLTTAFGGIIGVLGSYIGYEAARKANGNGGTTTMTTIEPPTGEEQTPAESETGERVVQPDDVPEPDDVEGAIEGDLDVSHHDETDGENADS